MAHQQQRISTFDLLRGIAVLTMIVAHSVYFFHNRENDFLLSVEGLGNTVSFVTFLLVSGAVASVAYFGGHHKSHGDGGVQRRKVFTRVLLLLIAYYVLALVLTGSDLLQEVGFARFRVVLDILSFRHLPGFTEYFPPFIFYSALLGLVPRWFFWAGKTLKNLILISLASLVAGAILSELSFGPTLQPWMALIAGAEGVYRFPLLQYLPIFLLGLYWGQRTLASEGLHAKKELSQNLFWFFALLAMLAYLVSFFFDIPLEALFSRWPPSLPFLALGLGFAFLIASLLYAARQLRSVRLLRDALLTLGQNALGLFWSHIFLLGLYEMAGGPKVSSLSLFLFLFLFLVLLSLALTTFLPFNFRLALTFVRKSHEEHEEVLGKEAVFRLSKDLASETALTGRGIRDYFFPDPNTTSKRVLRKRHKLSLSLVVVAAAALFFPATIEELALQRQQRDAAVWWSDSYAYRQEATLKNPEPFITLKTETPVALHFNHKILVDEGKSRADGSDIKLVYWSGREHVVTESYVENPESEDASLIFRIPVQMQGRKQVRFYYLYYGGFINPQPKDAPPEVNSIIQANFGNEESYPLIASVSKSWSLIGERESDTIAFNLTTSTTYTSPTVTYDVLDTTLSGTMTPSSDTSWEAIIPIDSLAAGTYRIQATLRDGEKEHKSQLSGFYRTQPLYVAWTQDWEGYDVSQAYLDAIEGIADAFDVPMTHFFNPRIYVTETISTQRARALTQWVQRRIRLGDGYGLHLHMLKDFVEHAGVEVKDEPNWGDSGNGYGVPMSAYSKEEQIQMLKEALTLLAANGFSKTTLFRAGGWYANLDTLAALEDRGFTVDSSARTTYRFGRNQLPGYWNIRPTTRPYYPSRTNQNKSADTKNFPILEIPNNGADSYAFSAQDMIDRFTENLGSGILREKQQVTYLSHPHWFDEKEQARVRELFTFLRRFTFADDQGPVRFTTTKAIADIWANE